MRGPRLEAFPHWGGATAFGQGAGRMVHVGVLGLLSGDLPGQGHLWWLWGSRGGWRKVELWPRRVMIQKKMQGPPAWLYWQEAVARWRRWVGSLRQKYRRRNKWLSKISCWNHVVFDCRFITCTQQIYWINWHENKKENHTQTNGTYSQRTD